MLVKTKRGDLSFDEIGERTDFVHIHGRPFLWSIVEILRRAPNLKKLRVIPTEERHLTEATHIALLKERGVEICVGHHRPELAWEKGEVRHRTYELQKNFFINMSIEQKKLFEELVAFDFESALVMRRYFCLDGEEYMTYAQLASEYGYSGNDSVISYQIYAIFRYLDPTYETNDSSLRYARNLVARVALLRETIANQDWMKRVTEQLGLPRLPDGMPLAHLEDLKVIVEAKRRGYFDADSRDHKMILQRFGLDGSLVWTTLSVVGDDYGLSRERVRQIEVEILAALTKRDQSQMEMP